jgi:ribosomal protein L37AE/L43A
MKGCEKMKCPACGSRAVGKVGADQYYCWDCFVEYQYYGNNQAKLYMVEEDGSLVEY